MRASSVALVGVALSLGCSTVFDEDVGVAVVSLTQVPADVACVRIRVAGNRTVEESFDVTPGEPSVLRLTGLPIGDDTFSAVTFAVPCSLVGATTIATWVGDPVVATVATGSTVAVTISLHRNGNADVSLDFNDGPDAGARPDGGGSRLPNGSPCTAAAACQSGFCADGVCCSTACGGACLACNLPGSVGTCGAVPSGAPDPHGVCVAQPPQTCGTNGTCNGQGGCAVTPAGTVCAPPACQGSVVRTASICDGTGTCVAGALMSCAPFLCNPATATCATTCVSSTQCVPPFACVNGTCGAKANGTPCAANAECASGFCTDGVCCSIPCTGVCQTCNAGGSAGLCVAAPAGTDPRNQCPDQGPASCGTDGSCSGTGTCRLYPPGTICLPPMCLGSVLTGAGTCNGGGTCVAGPTTACAPFTCANPTACRTSCVADPDCAPGFFCRAGVCVPPGPFGTPCTANAQCISGICTGGICAN